MDIKTVGSILEDLQRAIDTLKSGISIIYDVTDDDCINWLLEHGAIKDPTDSSETTYLCSISVGRYFADLFRKLPTQ